MKIRQFYYFMNIPKINKFKIKKVLLTTRVLLFVCVGMCCCGGALLGVCEAAGEWKPARQEALDAI